MKVAIFGSRGYLGRECLRILQHHSEIDTILPVSQSVAGERYARHVPGFQGRHEMFMDGDTALAADPDVVMFATENGVAKSVSPLCGDATVIDLSRDHRLEAIAGSGEWTYGLADVKPVHKGTKRIANPGCFPTATALASWPALAKGLATGPLISDGKSGVSGAGASPNPNLHFPQTNESVKAYKVLGHDHQKEIAAVAATFGNEQPKVRFTPHLVPQNRGLLATVYMQTTESEIQAVYEDAYANNPFVHTGTEPDTGHVRGTNHAHVAADVDDGILVARCAIDNVIKGGSGQAVQNMNDALGFASGMGLQMSGGVP